MHWLYKPLLMLHEFLICIIINEWDIVFPTYIYYRLNILCVLLPILRRSHNCYRNILRLCKNQQFLHIFQFDGVSLGAISFFLIGFTSIYPFHWNITLIRHPAALHIIQRFRNNGSVIAHHARIGFHPLFL